MAVLRSSREDDVPGLIAAPGRLDSHEAHRVPLDPGVRRRERALMAGILRPRACGPHRRSADGLAQPGHPGLARPGCAGGVRAHARRLLKFVAPCDERSSAAPSLLSSTRTSKPASRRRRQRSTRGRPKSILGFQVVEAATGEGARAAARGARPAGRRWDGQAERALGRHLRRRGQLRGGPPLAESCYSAAWPSCAPPGKTTFLAWPRSRGARRLPATHSYRHYH
jgi:hypothetical protein